MFWGDYARDTGHLGAAQHGAYLMLIKHYWCTGKPLPDDDGQLWRISTCDSPAAWKKIRPIIAGFFEIGGGEWRHGRVDEELSRAVRNVAKRSVAGTAGARAKWGKSDIPSDGKRMANASDPHGKRKKIAPESQWQNDGTSSSSSEKEKKSKADEESALPKENPPDDLLAIPKTLKNRGARLAENWVLPDDWRAWAGAERPDVDVGLEAQKFRDYWIGKAGADARKLDWLATWRNWIRNVKGTKNGGKSNENGSATSGFLDVVKAARDAGFGS